MKIVIGSTSKELGKSVVNKLNIQPYFTQVSRFADGEMDIYVRSDIYNQDVYIIQSISPPTNDSLVELMFTIDAVKRLMAKKITVIIPYYGYGRQDRVIKNNNMQSALSAKLVANLIQVAGANCVAIFDLHSSQTEGFFNIPVANLSCIEAFADSIYVSSEDLAIVAPDVGAIGRARVFAKTLERKYKMELSNKIVVIDKYRGKTGSSQIMNVIGEVTNKNCVIVDDIVDSGRTLCNAASTLRSHGAKSVISFITHGVLSGDSIEKISYSPLEKLVITDTIFHKFEKISKIKITSTANILVNFIKKEDKNAN